MFRKNLHQYYAKKLFHSNIKYRKQIFQNKNIILTTSFQTNYLKYEKYGVFNFKVLSKQIIHKHNILFTFDKIKFMEHLIFRSLVQLRPITESINHMAEAGWDEMMSHVFHIITGPGRTGKLAYSENCMLHVEQRDYWYLYALQLVLRHYCSMAQQLLILYLITWLKKRMMSMISSSTVQLQ